MYTEYEKGTFLRIQLNPETDKIEFIVGDAAWRSIEAGKLYPMSIKFGHRDPWYGDGRGYFFSEETPAIVVPVAFEQGSAELFIEELMRMPGVVVGYDGKEIARLSLRGTFAAMEEVMNCQALMLENETGSDPFTAGSGVGADPFQ